MTNLETEIKAKFRHLSNQQLIDRANRQPDFKWDDEGFELNRRREASGRKFTYAIKGKRLEGAT